MTQDNTPFWVKVYFSNFFSNALKRIQAHWISLMLIGARSSAFKSPQPLEIPIVFC